MAKKVTEFGKLCRTYRTINGFTMTDLAKKIGKNQSEITKIEQGEISISIDFVIKSIEAYGIKDKNKQLEFLKCYFYSSERFEVHLEKLGPLMKEWLAALCILGNVGDKNPEGWDELLDWFNGFYTRLKGLKPKFTTLSDPGVSI